MHTVRRLGQRNQVSSSRSMESAESTRGRAMGGCGSCLLTLGVAGALVSLDVSISIAVRRFCVAAGETRDCAMEPVSSATEVARGKEYRQDHRWTMAPSTVVDCVVNVPPRCRGKKESRESYIVWEEERLQTIRFFTLSGLTADPVLAKASPDRAGLSRVEAICRSTSTTSV